MRSADHPKELERVDCIQRLKILDTEPEPIYDDFVKLAAELCGAPIAALSFVEGDRQWFKASVGLDVCETNREASFCSHSILATEPTVVPNATKDSRFSDNELVTGEFHLRFYAGVPVIVEGLPLGSLCVIDREPRDISSAELRSLSALARQLSGCLEARLAIIKNEEITQQLQIAEATINYARKRFEALFQKMAVACFTTDANGCIHEYNQQAVELFGHAAHTVCGRVDSDFLLIPDDRELAIRTRNKVLKGKSIRAQERKVLTDKGEEIWTVFSAQPVLGPTGEVTGTINVYHNIADRKKLEEELSKSNAQLESLASTDSLTKIPNRRWISEFLETEFSGRSRHSVSVLLLDVDKFKQYNDTYGHPAGDAVLQTVAQVIQSACRTCDRVGRYGGEEFIVVLPRTEIDEAAIVAERIRAALESHNWPNRQVTASFGVATSQIGMSSVADLVSDADLRLYAAKEQGRNCVVTSHDEPDLANAS